MATTTNVPSSNFEDLQRDVKDATRFTNGSQVFTTRTGKTVKPISLIQNESLDIINSQFASVNTIQLSPGQTSVFLNAGDNYTRPSYGSAFYVNGERLNESQYSIVSDSNITLTDSYQTGSVLVQVANDTPANATAQSQPDEPINRYNTSMELIAHRGFRGSMPQNTMLAFTSAMSRGADALECDVQISADGTAYLFHDTTVDALTNGTGTFTQLSDAYIESLAFDELSGSIYSDVTIPKFEDFLKYAAGCGVRVYPEIKGYRNQPDIEIIADLVTSYNMTDKCVLQSFDLGDVGYVKTYNSDLMAGFLGSSTTESTYISQIDSASSVGAEFILWSYTSLLSAPQIVQYANSKGVNVAAWTVDNSTDAKELMKIGVRHIMSDIKLEVF